MSTRSDKYRLLENHEQDDSDLEPFNSLVEPGPRSMTLQLKRHSIHILASLNLILLAACLVFLVKIFYHETGSCPPEGGLTNYAKLARDPAVEWPYSTGYGADIENHTLLRERWNAISINDGVVAIDNDYALEHNLGVSQPFPWDSNKSLYLITAFHSIHCAKTVGQLLYEIDHELPITIEVKHALHCLDHWRTDVMCEADDYLLPTGPSRYMNHGPRGQARVCRNWDQLVGWAKERSSCYDHITTNEGAFAEDHSQVERFLNCPPNSPYYEQVEQFKREKGLVH